LYNLIKTTSGINAVQRKQLLIVSLTTYYKRFHVVHLAIESLMNQTVKPDKIILWLKKEELINNKIPKKLLKLKSRGLNIRIVNENIKSYAKLIYSLKEFPTSDIITADDDVIYQKNFIEGLYKKHQAFPKHIVAYRCSVMQKHSIDKLTPYLEWVTPENSIASFNLFPTGIGGVLYPPNSLSNKTLNKKLFTELAPLADDIWFKAMALLNNTKTIIVGKESMGMFEIIPDSQEEALHHINNGENKNDEQLKKVFDYFDLYSHFN
jgi:hypothetical protein